MGQRHLQAVRQVENADLVAVADVRAEALAAADLSGKRAYTDVQRMLTEVRPDVVIVATNAPSHHELVLSAIALGARGVLCEKPLACSVAEAEEIILASQTHECAVGVNFCRRHVPGYRWLAERLQSGQWGQLRSMQGTWPGIGLGCTATHMIDLWHFLGGEKLTAVFGWIDPVRGPNPRGQEFRDPGGMILCTSAAGTRYVHEQIEDGAGPGTLAIETTTAEVLVSEYARSVAILVRDPSVKPGPGRPPKYDAVELPSKAPLALDIVRLSAETLRELVEERELTCDAEDGLRSLEVIVCAHLSHDNGNVPVTLPFTDLDSKAKWLPIT
jgi:predicted dehydrogenase